MNTTPGTDPIRIFCGADRSQQLPFQVLAHSIRRHTAHPVEIQIIDNRLAPPVEDPRYAPYTEFSFGRFAIPAMCGYAGRAVYMDSDMLVFRDIAELWNTPMGEARIAIEIGSRDQADWGKHAAVMLMDCARLPWKVDAIVAGLGRDYDYNQLMAIDPLLAPGDMQELIPTGWNDLDHFEPGRTRNLHYTEIRTQPWVEPGHPHGDLWTAEIRHMLEHGALTTEAIETEVREGYVRPSLLVELGLRDGGTDTGAAALKRYDQDQGYVPHKRLLDRFRARRRAIRKFEADQAWARNKLVGAFKKLAYQVKYGRD
ncbi:glycosyltransferase [Coralloluteibacterium thermophilus]|uniref:Glycosyltransferase n=1 Tax=Coralloluteibacterium thermophilum TaxID=2707049 RepID=A0ABV9NFT6_9GAMM